MSFPAMPRPEFSDTPEAVRAVMRGNRSNDTRPELAIRSALHARGLRFRKGYKIAEGGPRGIRADLVFTRQRVVVFVDGCFWHCCPDHGHVPSANAEYWEPKLQRNAERDERNNRVLADAGWTVVRIWEHEPLRAAVESVLAALE